MAYHYVEPGTMPIVVGAAYARHPLTNRYPGAVCRLVKYHEGTGVCTLSGGWPRFISAAMLSHWHIVEWPAKR